MNYCYGIYCYIDAEKDNNIVYIGKDSHIDKHERHKAHLRLSYYNDQPFNSELQNNPNRYMYKVLEKDIESEDELNKLEISYIKKYNPKFNVKMEYNMWDNKKCKYHKKNMFQGYRDGSTACRCFEIKYNGKALKIGYNLDFTTPEIIHDLIDDALDEK